MNPVTAEAPAPSAKAPVVGRLAEFEVLYRSHVLAVSSFFARRSSDPQTVADLTADTFFEAMRSFGSFDPAKGSAPAWLFAIARRTYAKHCERSRRRRDATARDAARRVLDEEEIEELTRRIDAQRAGRELIARLAVLPESDRAAIELVDLAELTPREAAATLGVSPGALRVRLFRARARLRKEGQRHA
ncbi:MAG TPA: RNA polymerase sigma factor [Solirubrobacteraceae bacterium]